MKPLWTGCLAMIIAPMTLALTVSTTVDRDTVRQGESVVVAYTADEQVPEPDFSPIKADFEILHRGQNRSITVSSGQATVENTWRLVLRPRRGGELSLPAIQFGSQRSTPRTITVAAGTADAGQDGDVRIEYRVDDRTPYVSQPVVVTVTVRTPEAVEELVVSEPEVVEGAGRIETLGNARQYESGRDNRSYQVHEQRYTLVPDAAGMLRLSPVEVHGRLDGASMIERSAPVELEVLRARASSSGQDDDMAPDDLFLEVEVDKQAPYIQEQVILTVRVLRAIAIENASLSTPAVSEGDAVIERIGRDRRYQASRGDRYYAVTERRYALFPQTSGPLTIEPIRLSASVPLPSSSGGTTGLWNRPLTRSVRIESEPRNLSVKAPPADAPDPWLPARQMTLEEEWPETDIIEVGTPITRRITLRAEALMASQLPELEVPLPDAVKNYPERPRRETIDGELGLDGRLEQALAIIPSRAGALTVPELELEWWNTAKDRKETLRLPARTLQVAAGPALPPGQDAGSPAGPGSSGGGTTSYPRLAWWLSLGLGLAWLATLALWWRDRRRTDASGAGVPVRAGTVPRRRAETRLRRACRAGDTRAARDAMLAWGEACWPDRPPRSLGSLARTVDDKVGAELAALQEALYAPQATAWQGDGLYRAVVSFDPAPDKERRGGHALKPLYEQ